MTGQFVRYAMIGAGLNAALYGAYLLLTHTVMGTSVAMSFVYCAGVLIGFVLNRDITFRFHGGQTGALLRYVASYVIGYILNLAALRILVNRFGLTHEIVEGAAILTLPLLFFVLQRYWVFAAPTLVALASPTGPER
jgi:putative flippase GtrA